MIEKQLNTTNKWFKVATLEPTVMKYCVENLKEKSEYYFKIYAENCIGLSQPVETKLVSLLTHASKLTYVCELHILSKKQSKKGKNMREKIILWKNKIWRVTSWYLVGSRTQLSIVNFNNGSYSR